MDHDHRSPGVEDAVGNHGSDRRTADDVVTIDIAAEDAVVEVVGHAVIVNRTDVMRDSHVVTEVVVIRVHIRCRLRCRCRTGVASVVLRSRLRAGMSTACVASLCIIGGICRSSGRRASVTVC